MANAVFNEGILEACPYSQEFSPSPFLFNIMLRALVSMVRQREKNGSIRIGGKKKKERKEAGLFKENKLGSKEYKSSTRLLNIDQYTQINCISM